MALLPPPGRREQPPVHVEREALPHHAASDRAEEPVARRVARQRPVAAPQITEDMRVAKRCAPFARRCSGKEIQMSAATENVCVVDISSSTSPQPSARSIMSFEVSCYSRHMLVTETAMFERRKEKRRGGEVCKAIQQSTAVGCGRQKQVVSRRRDSV